MSDWTINPGGGGLRGELRLPSDKSISHRAIMLGGLAEGTTTIEQPLLGEDTKATLRAMEALGASSEQQDGTLLVTGAGAKLNREPGTIDCGNAGTLMRLYAGLVCGRNVSCVLDGDDSLRRRPMRRISEPLGLMGASISVADDGTPPMRIEAVDGLRRIEYELPKASAQIKSAVLLAGLSAADGACVIEPLPCRDHTELMLPVFGAELKRAGDRIEVESQPQLRAAHIKAPADISSAAFFIVAASLVPGSELVLKDVCVNPTRIGILRIMRAMGASIELANQRSFGNEPVADLVVKHAPLRGAVIGTKDIPAAIDELPVIFIAAAAADGQTKVRGAAELRAKESDRLAAMAQVLERLGIEHDEHEDGIDIEGGSFQGCELDSHGDHRIAMAGAVAGLLAQDQVRVKDCANVATSFPGFIEHAASAGWAITST